MRNWSFILILLLAALLPGRLAAADSPEPLRDKAIAGLLLHDGGPFSDRHESGVDPHFELQFTAPQWHPWRWIGAPSPMVGLTPNFKGDTSVFYGGINYEIRLSNR